MPLLSSLTSKVYRPVFREPFISPPGILDDGESFFSNNVTRTQTLALPNSPGVVEGITFSLDGTIAYALVGSSVIYQYNLSTAFDLTTLTYNNVSFNAASFTGTSVSATDIWVDDSGTRFYVLSDSTDNIDQFSMSTAHDLVNMTHVASVNLTTLDGEFSHTGMSIKSDGTKLFFIGSSGDSIYSFSMSTPWNIATLTYDNVSLFVGTLFVDSGTNYITVPEAIWTDGSKIIIIGTNSDSIAEINLSTPWDLSTASFYNFNRQFSDSSPKALWANSNYLFLSGGNGAFYRYTLGNGSLSHFVLKRGQHTQASSHRAGRFNDNGSKIFILDSSIIYEYDLTTNYDISTMTYNGVSYNPDPASKTSEQCFMFGDNGNKYYITGFNNSAVVTHTLSSPYDLSTITYVEERRLNSSNADGGSGLNISTNGSYAWMESTIDGSLFFVSFNHGIYKMSLSTAWDFSTAIYDSTDSSYSLLFSNFGLSFSEPVSFGFGVGGTKLYMFNRTTRLIYQFNLQSAYDFTQASLDSVNYDLSYLDSTSSTFTLFDQANAQSFYYANSTTRRHIYQFDV